LLGSAFIRGTAAAVAIFRFKLGVLTVLAGCATLGAIYTLTV